METDIKIIIAIIAAISSLVISIVNAIYQSRRISKEKLEDFRLSHYSRTLEAYLKFWPIFRYLSTKEGGNKSIFKKSSDNRWVLISKNVETFITELYDFFYSEHGIFLSKEMRKRIFTIRDELREQLSKTNDHEIGISNAKQDKLESARNKAIIQARNDIGLRDTIIPIEKLELIGKPDKKNERKSRI